MGQFSLGGIGFLITLPVILLGALLVWLVAPTGSPVVIGLVIAVVVIGILLVSVVTSAADTVFKAVLFSYATDRTLPADINAVGFETAFMPKE